MLFITNSVHDDSKTDHHEKNRQKINPTRLATALAFVKTEVLPLNKTRIYNVNLDIRPIIHEILRFVFFILLPVAAEECFCPATPANTHVHCFNERVVALHWSKLDKSIDGSDACFWDNFLFFFPKLFNLVFNFLDLFLNFCFFIFFFGFFQVKLLFFAQIKLLAYLL